MVLYSVITTYHLLEALVHKIKFKRKTYSILLISKWLAEKYTHYEQLNKIFPKIVIFDAGKDYDFNNPITALDEYFSNLFIENDISINKISEINSFGNEHNFGVYLACKKLKFNFWEEGNGAFGKIKEFEEHLLKIHGKDKMNCIKELKLIDGKNENVINRYCNVSLLSNNDTDRIKNFDLQEELNLLDKNDRDLIIKFFVDERIINLIINEKSTLLLTEHLANLNILKWDEQVLMYQLLTDYMVNENIIIKPHPDDLMNYEDIFFNSIVLRKPFPAELLPFIWETNPKKIFTISSTSVDGLRKSFKNIFEFNLQYSHNKEFYRIHKYYIAILLLLNKINKTIYIYGVNDIVLLNLLKIFQLEQVQIFRLNTIDEISNLKRNSILIIDDTMEFNDNLQVCSILNRKLNITICFINSQEDYVFYHPSYHDIWENIEIIEIEKRKIRDDNVYDNLQNEQIYIYSKEYIKMEKFSKKLKYTGIEITAEMFEDDKKKIKILEAMLRASENRLLYYMNEKNNSRGEN